MDVRRDEGVDLARDPPDHMEQVVDALRVERARSAVSKRIKAALKKIHALHPPLGRYLRATIKTGHVCSYVPDEAKPPIWEA
jgi:adenylate cyclase